MAGGLRTYCPTPSSLCATPGAAGPLAALRRRSRACRCPGRGPMGRPRAAAAPLVSRFPGRPGSVRPRYVTSALCRGMTVQPPVPAAAGGHGRRRAGRSGETFLTGVSIVETRHGALPHAGRLVPAHITAPHPRPSSVPDRTPPPRLPGGSRRPAHRARSHAGGATVGGWQIVRVRCW